MITEAVLVCKFCRTIFYRPVNRLIYRSVGACYHTRACYLSDLAQPVGVRFGMRPEDEVLEQCDRELAQAIIKRAYRDNDRLFLYSEQGKALIRWAFRV